MKTLDVMCIELTRQSPSRMPLSSRAASTRGVIWMSPMRVRDSLGTVHEFAVPPHRIVSLVPSITETLFALGAGSRVVAVTDFCIHPAAELSISILLLGRCGDQRRHRQARDQGEAEQSAGRVHARFLQNE